MSELLFAVYIIGTCEVSSFNSYDINPAIKVNNALSYLRNYRLKHPSCEQDSTANKSNRTREIKLERYLFTAALPQMGIYDFRQFRVCRKEQDFALSAFYLISQSKNKSVLNCNSN